MTINPSFPLDVQDVMQVAKWVDPHPETGSPNLSTFCPSIIRQTSILHTYFSPTYYVHSLVKDFNSVPRTTRLPTSLVRKYSGPSSRVRHQLIICPRNSARLGRTIGEPLYVLRTCLGIIHPSHEKALTRRTSHAYLLSR